MAVNLVRFTLNGGPRWGVAQANGVAPLAGDYPTTAALIERGEDDWRAAAGQTPSIGLEADRTPVASDHAVPRLLSGRQLPLPHDRIRPGPGRQGLQHVLHEVGRVDQPGDRLGAPAGSREAALS